MLDKLSKEDIIFIRDCVDYYSSYSGNEDFEYYNLISNILTERQNNV
jgi:hypothetical protein